MSYIYIVIYPHQDVDMGNNDSTSSCGYNYLRITPIIIPHCLHTYMRIRT